MALKLRKAIGAVKDQTSISLAKVTNAANLEISILKATTHNEVPMESRYVNEIVQLVSSNKVYAAACAQSIGKRIGKTRNWVVALKSLMLVLRIFQDGDPYFPREVFHAMKRGAKILNLSSFKDDSNSNTSDYTAFVRTFALYLDERLDCFLTGKLQRRFTYHNGIHEKTSKKKLSNEPGIKDMKPTMLLDKITYWQKLLDRAIGSRPTGPAKKNLLIQISLYAIVQESFDLYRDISDGLAVILDSFFQLPYKACVAGFQACVKSCKQFDELTAFYFLCISIGVGRTSEYPTVQKVSDELMETLREFLKDQASFPANNGRSPPSKHFFLPQTKDPRSNFGQDKAHRLYGTPEMFSESGSEYGSPCTSLEDRMSAADARMSPTRTFEQDAYSEQDEKQSQNDDLASENDFGSVYSLPNDQTTRSSLDRVSFDGFQQEEQRSQTKAQEQRKNRTLGSNHSSRDCWELVLVETATKPEQAPSKLSNGYNPSLIDALFDQPSSVAHYQYNPFLEDIATIAPSTTSTSPTLSTTENLTNFLDLFDAAPPAPTFQAMAPTFSAQNHSEATTAPTFTAQSSDSETSLARTFGELDLTGLTMAPAFSAQGSAQGNKAVGPTFHAQSLDEITAAPIFYGRGTYGIDSSPNFHAHNSNETSKAPTFSTQNAIMAMSAPTLYARGSNEIGLAPNLHALNSTETSIAPTFNTQNVSTELAAPSLYARGSYEIGSAPNLQTHNSNETSISPTFSTQNVSRAMSAPSLDPQNFNQAMVPFSFWVQNFDDTKAPPTFCAKDSIETKMATPTNDDHFGTWPSALTNEHISNKSIQEQSLLLQQQMWLQQQNKIVGRKMI